VAVGEEADRQALHEAALTDDHLPDLRQEGPDEERLFADPLGEGGRAEARRGG
jgi:hypothetical protein